MVKKLTLKAKIRLLHKQWQQSVESLGRQTFEGQVGGEPPDFWRGYAHGLEHAIRGLHEAETDTEPVSYAEALALLGTMRWLSITPMNVSHLAPPYPDESLDGRTQAKIYGAVLLMLQVGRLPGDWAIRVPVNFRKIPPRVVREIESKLKIPVRSEIAPLSADFLRLFDCGYWLPDPNRAERFFGYLTDILLKETQIMTAIQYFEASGLRRDRIPDAVWREVMGDRAFREMKASHGASPSLIELHVCCLSTIVLLLFVLSGIDAIS